VVESWLSIGEVARRTGLTPATLRIWESRYGFPEPARGAGGQRRYADHVVDQVRQVIADRAAGLGLPAAVERVRADIAQGHPSVHAGLRRRRPELPVHRFTKRALGALSHAIEDEGHNRAESPILVAAGFQQERFYRSAQARWEDLARGAALALAFADFDQPSALTERPIEIPIDATAALRREWFVVWYGPRYSACLSARELPGQSQARDRDRFFETVWGVDSGLVWDAAELTCALASRGVPGLQAADVLRNVPSGPTDDLAVMSGLTNRMMAYLGVLLTEP
jgi:DICT domain-containing protein